MLQSFIFAEKIPGTELIWYNKNSFCRYLYNRENVAGSVFVEVFFYFYKNLS